MGVTKKVGGVEVALSPTTAKPSPKSPLVGKLQEHLAEGKPKPPVVKKQPAPTPGTSALPPASQMVTEHQAISHETVIDKTKAVTHEKQEVVASMQSAEPVCNVGVSAKYTKNLGNYESASLQVSLHIPCKKEDIDTTFEWGRDWVNNRMEQLVNDLT